MTEPERKILTIDRAKWRRGGDTDDRVAKYGNTLLLNESGYMCCLGFDAVACGVPDDQIAGAGEPTGVPNVFQYDAYNTRSRFAVELDDDDLPLPISTQAIHDAMSHNDDESLSDDERERLIRHDLIALGWDDVVFV